MGILINMAVMGLLGGIIGGMMYLIKGLICKFSKN